MTLVRFIFLLSILAGNPAWAEPATGSRVGERLVAGEAMSTADSIRNMHTVARCIVFKRDGLAERYLTSVDASEISKMDAQLYRSVDCETWAGTDASMTDAVFVQGSTSAHRGVLAEAVLRKRGKLTERSQPAPALPMAEGYNRAWFLVTERPNSVNAMATCIAETQPGLTKSLLSTDVNSDAEKAAVARVVSVLGPCLVAGTQLKANAFILRAAIAEAYFHRFYGNNDNMPKASKSEGDNA